MQAKGVVFDLYYTLVCERDDNPFYADVASELNIPLELFRPHYNACGRPTMRGELDGMVGRVTEACRLANHTVSDAAVAAAVERNMPTYYDSVSVYPDALQTLRDLYGLGFKIAIASNASAYSEEVLRRSGVTKHVDAVVMSYKLGCLKPDHRIYEAACSGLGVTAHEAIFVGDGGDQELEGARSFGMKTILIDRSLRHTAGARAHATHELKTLAEVVKIAEAGTNKLPIAHNIT